jgi:phosphoribosylamine--glycine ligase
MPAAQDHKRLLDGDKGPNTGGMGAFAPSPLASAELLAEVGQTIIAPTLSGMAARGTPYVGVLYAGLMLTQEGPKVLEFNCRFGDPESQVILPLLESDLVGIFMACIEGQLDKIEPLWHNGAAATVVMASGGYPIKYQKGYPIRGIAAASKQPGVIPFHAGTAHQDGNTITAGGRVLAVSGVGDSLHEALRLAYTGVKQIDFEGVFYRQDIGQRG